LFVSEGSDDTMFNYRREVVGSSVSKSHWMPGVREELEELEHLLLEEDL